MNKIITIFFISMLFTACGNSSRQAAAYNNKIIGLNNQISTGYDQFFKSLNNSDTLKIKKDYKKLFLTITLIEDSLSQVGNLKKDSTLFDAAQKLFGSYKKVTSQKIDSLVQLFLLPADQYNVDDLRKLKKLQQESNTEIKKAIEKFTQEQEKFAKTYNLELN